MSTVGSNGLVARCRPVLNHHRGPAPFRRVVPFDQTSCGVTQKLPVSNRGTDANSAGQQAQILRALAAHCSVTAKAQDKFTRRQNVERYRRLLKTATDEARRSYLRRLIVEEQQKQNEAGDSEYQY